MSSVLLISALSPRAVAAWPADGDWQPLTVDGADLLDNADVVASTQLDLVSDTEPAGYWAADESTLYFRLRLGGEPCSSYDSNSGECSILYSGTYAVLMSTDGEHEGYEFGLILEDYGGDLSVVENSDGEIGWMSPWATVHSTSEQPLLSGLAQVAEADSNTGGNPDYYIDLQVPYSDLIASIGEEWDADLRIALATGSGGASVTTDLAGADNLFGSPALEAVISDALVFDSDGDGLSDAEEEALGTDLADIDSDDDGLTDGEEANTYGSDPLICDSDEDGLLDGLEAGLTEAGEGTDTDAGCFAADADPTTTTDPASADTDGGGLADGEEDLNLSGQIDAWETDPNDPADDVDADDDGITDALEDECGGSDGIDNDSDGVPDSEEGTTDTDGDGLPDFCDDDDDGDGIPTAEEGSADTDGDGTPDHLDLDSDDDGALDSEEGTGDVDCDEIRNFQDANDNDGPCGDDIGGDTGDSSDTGGPFGFTGGSFTGGSCSAVNSGAALLPALLAGLLVLARRRRRLGLLALLLPGSAAAQEVNAQLFEPSLDGRIFTVVDDTVVGPKGVGASTWINHANDPLIYRYGEDDSREDVALLGSVTTADLIGFANLKKLRLGIDLPLHLSASGYELEGYGGRLLGDVRLEGKYALTPRKQGLGLSAGLGVSVPTGSGLSYLGASTSTVTATLGAATGEDLVLAANLGATIAPSSVDQLLGELTTGSRLNLALGAAAKITDPVWVAAELTGQRLLRSAGAAGATPLEGIASLRLHPRDHLVATLGMGAGLTRGVGSPDFRVVTGIGWIPQRSQPAAPSTPAVAMMRYTITVTDPEGQPVRAWVNIPDLEQQFRLGVDGEYRGTAKSGTYEILLDAEGYSRTRRVLKGEADGTVIMDVVMRPSRVRVDGGRVHLTERIFFELDSSVIKADSFGLLDELAATLNDHPELRLIEIQGHTDDQGDDAYNLQLSKERAAAVRTYLTSHGEVETSRLVARGYGEQRPLQPNTSAEAQATNRRVEFHILQPAPRGERPPR